MNAKTNAVATTGTTTSATADKTPAAQSGAATDGKGAEPTAETPKPDPFAGLKVVKVGEDDNVVDMSGLETSAPRKYAKVAEDAAKDKLPLMRGWKHAQAVFVPGTNKGGENGFKPGSVYGTIADIVNRAGRSGISAQDLVTQVRQRQLGNKRSHYCEKLPPVGWAEGWINSAVNKNICGVHASKRAPALYVAAKDSEATDKQNADAKAKAAA